MSITYPTTLDTLVNPLGGDALNSPSHATQHSNANDAIEALEAKVGADSSAVTTSHDYKLSAITGTDKAVGEGATQTLTNKTLTSPILNLSSNATGDMYFRKSDGTLDRLPIGSATNIIQVSAGGVPEWTANPNAINFIATISITSANILALNTTPITLVASPGAGKIIIPESMVWSLDAGTQYANGSVILTKYDGGSVEIMNSIATTAVTSAGDIVEFIGPKSGEVVATEGINKALQISCASAYITGTGTAKIFIKYRIITL